MRAKCGKLASAAPGAGPTGVSSAVPMFDLRGVTRTYTGAGPAVTALQPTNLRVDRGSFTAVIGPSGSGKSTLLNLMGLLDRPSAGWLAIDGVDTMRLGHRDLNDLRASRIGFVFQEFHLVHGRNVLENVELSLLYAGVRKRTRQKVAAEVIDRVGLRQRAHADSRILSGGERQRVAIARAVAAGAQAVLCDEPTGNLDRRTGASVLELLQELQRDGATVVVVTHEAGISDQADVVVTVADGMAQAGPASPPLLPTARAYTST